MHRLLASADVFLENFRDGQLEKQGLGADELRRKYPHLIVAGHKGFLSGPYEHRPALDEVVQMMSGLAAMTGTSEKPQRVGSSANDIMGGMFGAISILAALYQKRGGRQGRRRYPHRTVRKLPVPRRPAHGRIRDDRQPAALDAGTRARLADLRHFRDRGRRAHLHRRRHRRPLAEFLPGVRPAGIFWTIPTLRTTTDRILARSRIIPRVAEVIKGWNAAELSATLDRLNICFSPINRPEDLFERSACVAPRRSRQ